MYFGNDPRPGDGIPIITEPEEYVVNRNASRKHKELLDYINFIDEPRFDNKEMAHSAIDEAMALNTLSQIGMQGGGEIEDPKTMQSIGVKDELKESLDYFKFIDDILESSRLQSEYSFGKPERESLKSLREQGVIDLEQAIKHLNHIQSRYQKGTVGFHSPRYKQDGGMITYGDQSSDIPSLSDIYKMAGVEPKAGQQKTSFEAQFKYDPAREATTIADYTSTVKGLRSRGADALGKVTSDSSRIGKGFSQFGQRQSMQDTLRTGAERDVSAGVDSAQRSMFESIRGDRESYIQSALAELRRLESVGGTTQLFHANAPENPSVGDTYTRGLDDYEWNGTRWVNMSQDVDDQDEDYSDRDYFD